MKHFWHTHIKEKVQEELLQVSAHLMEFLLPSMMNSTHNPGLRDDSVYPVETLHYPKEHTHIQQKSVTTKLVYKTVTGFIEINTKLHRFSLLTQEWHFQSVPTAMGSKRLCAQTEPPLRIRHTDASHSKFRATWLTRSGFQALDHFLQHPSNIAPTNVMFTLLR